MLDARPPGITTGCFVTQPEQQPVSQIEEYRPAQTGAFSYDGPDIFPDAGRYRGGALRQYMEEAMIALAAEGRLRVVDIFNQPAYVRDMAGDIIRGITIVDHRQQIDPFGEAKPELTTYMVRVRALPIVDPQTGKATGGYHEIKWKHKMAPIMTGKFSGKAQYGKYSATGGGADASRRLRHEDVWRRAPGTEALLPLPTAYIALKQYGKFCRPEIKIENQRRHWWFEEVASEPEQTTRGKK